jgi:hypothetical protein
MKLRVRVIDIRGTEPKIAYQELIQHRHLAPTNEARVDYMNVCYGTWKFSRTAMAVAHQKIVDSVVKRLDHYVVLAKANSDRAT